MNSKANYPLRDALDAESYNWLTDHMPKLLDAIEAEIAAGRTPAQLRRMVQDHLGPDRAPLALRVEQAARAIMQTRGQG